MEEKSNAVAIDERARRRPRQGRSFLGRGTQQRSVEIFRQREQPAVNVALVRMQRFRGETFGAFSRTEATNRAEMFVAGLRHAAPLEDRVDGVREARDGRAVVGEGKWVRIVHG